MPDLTEDQIFAIEQALREGSQDARTIAADFGTTRQVVMGMRMGLQARMDAMGEGSLPVPPPTSRTYHKKPLSAADEQMRAEYLSNERATPAELGLKYGLDRWRARYVLDRDPSVIMKRIAQQKERADAKIAKLRELVLPSREWMENPWGKELSKLRTLDEAAAAKAMGFETATTLLNWLLAEGNAGNEEAKAIWTEWRARRAFTVDQFQSCLPRDLSWETYWNAWKEFSPERPVWKDGRLTRG